MTTIHFTMYKKFHMLQQSCSQLGVCNLSLSIAMSMMIITVDEGHFGTSAKLSFIRRLYLTSFM